MRRQIKLKNEEIISDKTINYGYDNRIDIIHGMENFDKDHVDMVGLILVGNTTLKVYESIVDPLFNLNEICEWLLYNPNTNYITLMKRYCEENQYLKLPIIKHIERSVRNEQVVTTHVYKTIREEWFINQKGLYNIMVHSEQPMAKRWKNSIFDEIIALQKRYDRNLQEEFNLRMNAA